MKIREVMTNDPVALDADHPIAAAAKEMSDRDIGDVLVTRHGKLTGILTDRDVVVRCVAGGHDPKKTPIRDACSEALAVLSPDDDVDLALTLMRDKAIRRIPVVEADMPVGILSLGDIAVKRQEASTLGAISSASPNN